MWQRLISISLSISQVMGTDTFSFSNWATFMLILWYSDTQGLFRLYLGARARERVRLGQFIAPNQCSCCSLFHHKMEPPLSLTGSRDKRATVTCVSLWWLFSNTNDFVMKSNHVMCSIMNLHCLMLISFWYLRVRAWIFNPPSCLHQTPLSLAEATASLWTSR